MKQIETYDLVNEALQHAGEPTVVTPELIELDKDRITSESVIADEEYLIKMNGVPCFPRCDLTTMTGPAKTGKTNVAAMVMACCVSGRMLGFERIGEQPLKVMWFDTEQSQSTTKRIMIDRIGKMIGSDAFPDDQFFVYNVRNHIPKERVEMLALAISTYKPDICFVDGIADLMDDINSGPASVELMQRLLTLASENKCNITTMIHLNRTGERLNLRGWIGTVMVQKSYEVFNCDKVPDSQMFTINLTFSRRYYTNETLYYEFDDDGMPCLSEKAASSKNARKGKTNVCDKEDEKTFNKEFVDTNPADPKLPWNFRKLFDTAMGDAGLLSCEDLEKRVMKLSGIRMPQYYAKVFEAAEQLRVVKRVLNRGGRVVVIRLS